MTKLNLPPVKFISPKQRAIEFADWIKEIGFEKYAEGWCQAGGSNGWHCTTEELYEKFRTKG